MADDNRKHTVDYKEVELRILAYMLAYPDKVPLFTRAATGRLSRPTDVPQLKNLPRVGSTDTGKDGS